MRNNNHKKVKDLGPFIIDERNAGVINSHTTALVMDNVQDREKMKPRIKIMYTSNEKLLAGSSTVAIFRPKKQADIFADDTKVLDELPAGSAFRTNEYGQLLVKQETKSVDGKTEALNPFGQTVQVNDDQIVITPKKENPDNCTNLFTNYLNKKSAAAMNNGTK